MTYIYKKWYNIHMERSIKDIRADIIKDLSISHSEINGYSPLEKFQFKKNKN